MFRMVIVTDTAEGVIRDRYIVETEDEVVDYSNKAKAWQRKMWPGSSQRIRVKAI